MVSPHAIFVSMSDDRLERILDAAYTCFARYGVRRTTMDDIAVAAEMSRAAVYQHVRNKDDAFRRLTTRIFDAALARANAAAEREAPLVERLHDILSVKVDLVLQLVADSPHAEELLGASSRVTSDLYDGFGAALQELVTGVVVAAEQRGEITLADIESSDIADLVMSLTRGLEARLNDPILMRRRLRQGIDLLIGGLSVR